MSVFLFNNKIMEVFIMANYNNVRQDEEGYRFYKKQINGQWVRPAHAWEIENNVKGLIEHLVKWTIKTRREDGSCFVKKERKVVNGEVVYEPIYLEDVEYFMPCKPPKALAC